MSRPSKEFEKRVNKMYDEIVDSGEADSIILYVAHKGQKTGTSMAYGDGTDLLNDVLNLVYEIIDKAPKFMQPIFLDTFKDGVAEMEKGFVGEKATSESDDSDDDDDEDEDEDEGYETHGDKDRTENEKALTRLTHKYQKDIEALGYKHSLIGVADSVNGDNGSTFTHGTVMKMCQQWESLTTALLRTAYADTGKGGASLIHRALKETLELLLDKAIIESTFDGEGDVKDLKASADVIAKFLRDHDINKEKMDELKKKLFNEAKD